MKTLCPIIIIVRMKINTIYIDESGNPKNTEVFIICLIIFADKYDIDFTIKNIQDFKYKRFKTEHQELHFNRESSTTKTNFFKVLNQSKFKIRYYIAQTRDKDWSNEDHIIRSIQDNVDVTNNSIIYIDGNISKQYRRFIVSKITKRLKDAQVNLKYIKYENSKNNALIQLADMCAGCIRCKIEKNTKIDQKLYNLIEKFITHPISQP
jgi:hypothetical protein